MCVVLSSPGRRFSLRLLQSHISKNGASYKRRSEMLHTWRMDEESVQHLQHAELSFPKYYQKQNLPKAFRCRSFVFTGLHSTWEDARDLFMTSVRYRTKTNTRKDILIIKVINLPHSQALLLTSTEVNGSSAFAFNRVEQSQRLLSVNSLRIIYCLPSTTVKINFRFLKNHTHTQQKTTGVKVCVNTQREALA